MSVARWLIAIGVVLIVMGVLWPWLAGLGLGHLPGDIRIERKGSAFIFRWPVASSCRWSLCCCSGYFGARIGAGLTISRGAGMKFVEQLFEGVLWNSRFVVVIAVIASIATSFTMFFVATVDAWYLVAHIFQYAASDLTAEARKALHDDTITHVVEVVDGYLLALVMLIFSLGMYELFVSDIDEARASKTSSKILVIENLDDLKSRLAKVILMILIVLLFERAVKMRIENMLDLVYLGASIALIGAGLYLSHAADRPDEAPARHDHE